MSDSKYRLYCCGSRGSRPVEGRRFNEFGGFTSCYVLKKDNYALVIDCGTGLYEANSIILDCAKIDVVITHMHYDHVLGMLDWDALPPKSDITFYSTFDNWFGSDSFNEFFREPFWPVQPKLNLKNVPEVGSELKLTHDLSVEFSPSVHPDKASLIVIRNRADDEEHRIVIMFDCEDPDAIDFDVLYGCDYLLYDGMYSDAEYPSRNGYGHSTWQMGCRLASRINCKKLIITHHLPNRTDDQLRKFEKLSRDMYPDTDFARSGQSWPFPANDNSASSGKAAKKEIGITHIINDMNNRFNEMILNNELRQKLVGLGIYIIFAIVSLFMTFVNIATGKTLLMYSTLIFSMLCGLNILFTISLNINYKIVQTVFQIEILALCTFFIVSGTPEGFSALWVLLLPVGGMIAFGKRRTTVLSIIMFLILLFFFYTEVGRAYLHYNYTESFMLRFPMAFAAFFAVGYFLETVRERTYNEIESLKNHQADTIADQTSELRDQNFELLSVNAKLELSNKLLRKAAGDDIKDESIKELLNDLNSSEDE